MWMACYSQQEIADAIGYAIGPVNEFLKSLKSFGNGTGAENEQSSEKHQLTGNADGEYDDDSNS